MTSEPVPIFDCDSSKLYTYMVEDNGIPSIEGYFHYFIYDVANCDFSTGKKGMSWLESFTFNFDGTQLIDDPDFIHPHVHLVYEQPGPLQGVTENADGCQGLFDVRAAVSQNSETTLAPKLNPNF